MPNFFKKLGKVGNNIFKKIDNGASNFFKKLPDEASNIAGKIGSGLDDAGNAIAGAAKKTGNFLEKNTAILSDVGAGVATALGQPELVAPILAAGNSGAALGQQLKRGGSQAQTQINRLGQMQQRQLSNAAGKLTDFGNNALGQARVTVNNATNSLTNLATATNGLNNLTIH